MCVSAALAATSRSPTSRCLRLSPGACGHGSAPVAWVSDRRWVDEGVSDFGDPSVRDAIEAETAVRRPVRQMPGPGHGNGVLAGNQRLDVVSNHTTREL